MPESISPSPIVRDLYGFLMITLIMLMLSVFPSKKRIGSDDRSGLETADADAPTNATGIAAISRRLVNFMRYCPGIGR